MNVLVGAVRDRQYLYMPNIVVDTSTFMYAKYCSRHAPNNDQLSLNWKDFVHWHIWKDLGPVGEFK